MIERVHGLGDAAHGLDLRAGHGEHLAKDLAGVELVLDEEDPDARKLVGVRCARALRRGRRALGEWADRDLEGELGAVAEAFARGVDRAAVRLDEVADDGEAEPEAAVAPRGGGVALAEALEDVGQERGRDALAVIAHGDDGGASARGEGDVDLGAARAELDGVGEEVPHDLLEPALVALDRADAGVDLRAHGDALGRGGGVDGVDRGLDDAGEIDAAKVEAELVGDDA